MIKINDAHLLFKAIQMEILHPVKEDLNPHNLSDIYPIALEVIIFYKKVHQYFKHEVVLEIDSGQLSMRDEYDKKIKDTVKWIEENKFPCLINSERFRGDKHVASFLFINEEDAMAVKLRFQE